MSYAVCAGAESDRSLPPRARRAMRELVYSEQPALHPAPYPTPMSSHAQPAPLPHSPRRPPRASTASSSRRPLPAPAPTPGPRQRALCIGIRDIRTLDYQDEEEEWSPLPHAHDDVDRIVGMLQRHHGYQSDEIHIMKDAPGIRRRLQPTRLNIVRTHVRC
jgi:hypothetical protein